jgi:hypothetical protein
VARLARGDIQRLLAWQLVELAQTNRSPDDAVIGVKPGIQVAGGTAAPGNVAVVLRKRFRQFLAGFVGIG